MSNFCAELQEMIDAMDGWQRSNMKDTYSRHYPRGTNTSDYGDENFDIFMLRIGVDLLKDQESKSPLAESFTTKPIDHSHPGFRHDYKDPSAQGTYHAYPRPELKTETRKVKLKRRFKDLGDVNTYNLQPGKGLPLEAYQRLFWVIGFQWRPETEKDERASYNRTALNAISHGKKAIHEDPMARD